MLQAVDLFAGAGGFTTGAKMADIEVAWCGNHWKLAVETHAVNHPETIHLCQDLHQANWTEVPAHDLLLASPACTGHTKARGKEQKHHDDARSTAWAVISCAEVHRPSAIVIENVPEFLEWVLWPSYKDALARLGYALETHVLDAADFGVPQNRERMFIIATRSKAPIGLKFERQPHVPVNDIIHWDRYKWSQVDRPGRAPATLERVAAGRKTFGERFVMPYYGNGSGKTGRGLSRPLGTVTTVDRWAVVDGAHMRMLQVDEYKAAMSFPTGYKLPKVKRQAVHLLGNAVCPKKIAGILTELQARL